MGLLREGYATLLSPLRRASSPSKEDCVRERDFDIADSMEKGMARELVADFMEPLPDAAGLWKFSVQRSDDRQEYRLYCNSGEFLMYAKLARDGRRIDIHLYDPLEQGNHLYDPDRPAFTMACNTGKTEWTLFQDRCDNCRHSPRLFSSCSHCRGRAEVLRVLHSDVEIGDGINHCMDLIVPADPRDPQSEEQRYITKMPVWNEKVECLVLDFKGRKIQASAKNFQLASETDESERVVCQYGKLGGNTFGLDFRYPLTVAQAFGAAMTTLFWV